MSNSNPIGITQKQLWLGLVPLISLSGITCLLLGSQSFAATLEQMAPSIAQQPANSDAAEQVYQEAFQLYKQGTAESLRQAIPKFEQAVILYRQAGEKGLEAASLVYVGSVYDSLGEKHKALEFYNQALPLYRAVGDRGGEATTLNNIGLVYNSLGEKQKALEFYNQALPLYRAVGDRGGEAATLNNIGFVYDSLGEKQKALEFYNQVLPLTREVGHRRGEATILNNIGLVYSSLGEKQTALEYYNQALPLIRVVGDRGGEAATLSNIGLVYESLGEKHKALDFYNQALSLTRVVGDRGGEATALNNIGKVYSDLGEQQKALDFYNQALPLLRAVGDRGMEATTLNNIGNVYNSLGEKHKALEFYNQALPLYRAVGDRDGEATTLNNVGGVYNSLGEQQKALDFYNQALPLTRVVGYRGGEAATLNNIGLVYDSLGEKQKALEFYNQALPLSRAVGDRGGEATTLYNVASLQRSQGNLKSALTLMDNSITIIEDLRTKIGSQELRASYFATVQNYYKFYIDLLMQLHQQNPSQGYDALALHTSERARARSLIELLTEANANIRQGVDPKLLEQENTLTQQLNALERRRYELSSRQYTEQQLDEIKQQSQSLLTQLDQLKAQIRVTSPRYAALKYPEPLNLQQIQQQVLDDDTLLLEYSLGEERSYLWAVTTTIITSYVLPKRSEIEAAAQTFRQSLTPNSAANLDTGLSLSQMLLAPVSNQLGNKRLLIVGDGALQSVPFAALPIPTSPPVSLAPPLPPFLRGVKEGSQQFFPTSLSDLDPPQPPLKKGGARIKVPLKKGDLGGSPALKTDPKTPPFPAGVGESKGLGYTPLLAQHEIITLPSASTVAIQRRQLQNRPTAAKTLAVLADPIFALNDPRFSTTSQPTPEKPTNSALTRATRNLGLGDSAKVLDRLQYTGTEAKKILALVPEAKRLQALDFNASRTTATDQNLAQYQIIHLATHGLLDPINPELSGIVLSLYDQKGQSQDGFLRLHDIFNLNLPAELVVLSACETGLGKDVKGEGLVGLTRGFMYAGSRRVVVSLWSVNDVATSEVMAKFYQKMLKEGQNPVSALRAAQLEMWKSQQWQAPYYWAAFSIQGDWR